MKIINQKLHFSQHLIWNGTSRQIQLLKSKFLHGKKQILRFQGKMKYSIFKIIVIVTFYLLLCTMYILHMHMHNIHTQDKYSMINVNLCTEVKSMIKRLQFFIDDIHEMNQIVLNPYSYLDQRELWSKDGDAYNAVVSQHFVSLVYHVDYIQAYFGPICGCYGLITAQAETQPNCPVSPSPLLAPVPHWIFWQTLNFHRFCSIQPSQQPSKTDRNRNTSAPQTPKQVGFIYSFYQMCTVCVGLLLCRDAGVNNFRIHPSQKTHIFLYFFQ